MSADGADDEPWRPFLVEEDIAPNAAMIVNGRRGFVNPLGPEKYFAHIEGENGNVGRSIYKDAATFDTDFGTMEEALRALYAEMVKLPPK